MAPPPPSTGTPELPRRSLRSALLLGCVALLPLWLIGLLGVWQSAPGPRSAATIALQRPAARVASGAPETAADAASPAARFLTPRAVLDRAAPETPASAPDLQAGQQVMRCIEHGRVTYRDLKSACPEGVGEAVTLFPTRGVEKYK